MHLFLASNLFLQLSVNVAGSTWQVLSTNMSQKGSSGSLLMHARLSPTRMFYVVVAPAIPICMSSSVSCIMTLTCRWFWGYSQTGHQSKTWLLESYSTLPLHSRHEMQEQVIRQYCTSVGSWAEMDLTWCMHLLPLTVCMSPTCPHCTSPSFTSQTCLLTCLVAVAYPAWYLLYSIFRKQPHQRNYVASVHLAIVVLSNFLLAQHSCSINLAFTMTWGKIIPSHITSSKHSHKWSQWRISSYEVPSLYWLKLRSVPIAPHYMMVWKTSLAFQVVPMQHKIVSYVSRVMQLLLEIK